MTIVDSMSLAALPIIAVHVPLVAGDTLKDVVLLVLLVMLAVLLVIVNVPIKAVDLEISCDQL